MLYDFNKFAHKACIYTCMHKEFVSHMRFEKIKLTQKKKKINSMENYESQIINVRRRKIIIYCCIISSADAV